MLKSSRQKSDGNQIEMYHISVQRLHSCWFQRHFNSKILIRYFQLHAIMGVQSYYLYATLNSCKYLKSETHLGNVQVNKASSANKEIVKICLVVDMVRKYWSLWVALLRFGWFWFILSLCEFQQKDLNICFSQL